MYKLFGLNDFYLLFCVLKSVYRLSKLGWHLTSFKWMKTRQKSYFLLLNELLTCSIFQNSWIFNGTCVKFIPSVTNLGITPYSTLSLHQRFMNICRVAYLELRRINSIQNLVSVDAVKTLVCSFVLSRLDYCISLLAGLPQCLIKRLQGVQNAAARLILRTPRSEHISPLLQNLT